MSQQAHAYLSALPAPSELAPFHLLKDGGCRDIIGPIASVTLDKMGVGNVRDCVNCNE